MIRLDHVNVRADNQEAVRDFLVTALGLRVGPRPPLSYNGYWLYLGDIPVVHTGPRNGGARGEGFVDHFAFSGFDFEERKAALSKAGFKFDARQLPDTDIGQLFVNGPEGIRIELQCPPKGTV